MEEKSNVTLMADYTDDARMVSPIQGLEEAIEYFQSGEWEGIDKCLVLALDTRDGAFDISFLNSGMNLPQMLALLEYSKSLVVEMMSQ